VAVADPATGGASPASDEVSTAIAALFSVAAVCGKTLNENCEIF
jgi:hypothetical protein